MSGFGSIDDLMKQSQKAASAKQASAKPAPAGAEEMLQKKMGDISVKEKEIETMRYAAALGYPHIDLDKFPIAQNALRQIPEEEARAASVVCFFANQEEFRLGALDPNRAESQEILRTIEDRTHTHGAIYVISPKSFERVLNLYLTLPVVKAVTKDIQVKGEDLEQVKATVNDFHSLQDLIAKTSTTDLLTFLLGAALKLDSSDIHVEAEEKGIMVRYRLDGILHDAAVLPKESYRQLVSRIKLVSSLKINITENPQDGRFTVKLPNGDVDIRVSTIPTVYGESIVMRLLRQDKGGIELSGLGFKGRSYETLLEEIHRPNGMIITTGPTGSGKTTTMYAIMQILNKPGVKIITLEDPVEYKMEGINQSQIDHNKGYTFAKGLRSMLRQDPDIAMVGEIRDLETADIAIQAALTGHLIMSTIHTNSASGAIPRFLSMGVKPFLLAPALNAVIGQRLVRKICEKCKEPEQLDAKVMEHVNRLLDSLPAKEKEEYGSRARIFYAGKGCETCNGIGYKGRVGILEIFVVHEDMEQLILSTHISEFEIEKVAKEAGMVTMAQDGLMKALDSMTSVEEVFRVTE